MFRNAQASSKEGIPMTMPAYVKDWKRKNADEMKRSKGLKALVAKLPKDTYVVYGGMCVTTNDEAQDIADNGVLMPGRGALLMIGERSQCHYNTARLYSYSVKRIDAIVTGYALSKDGLWREHTWGLLKGKIVETTERRVAYFGKVLNADEAREFVDNEMW